METYEQLLKAAREKLPEKQESSERFEMPRVKGHLQGNKTVISNFSQIVSALRRDTGHIVKYLQRELATPADIDGPRLVLGRKLAASTVNSKIEQYANDFVLCKICKKPDTILTKENKITFLKCQACGAKNPVRAKI